MNNLSDTCDKQFAFKHGTPSSEKHYTETTPTLWLCRLSSSSPSSVYEPHRHNIELAIEFAFYIYNFKFQLK